MAILPHSNKITIGWEEWCSFKRLNIPAIKAKIDTGAKTSALHAFDIHPFTRLGQHYVHFKVYPLQRNTQHFVLCTAPLVDYRRVMNSGGHQEMRYVISTPLTLGANTWTIQITLTDRTPLAFRMLLGREALRGHVIIDPSRSHLQGKWTKSQLHSLYRSR
jgi:ribosomal protein S6--L-glutamate ligase